MNLKDIPKKLLGPEYYMEYENKDVRLSVSKINDFIETLGDSAVSLIYSNKEEYHNVDNRLLNIIRRIHIRHAIIDLNNCFDILLQVPWFHYRIWKEYNTGGKYCNSKTHKRKYDIIRNSKGWVNKAEKSCDYDKVLKYLNDCEDIKLKSLANSFENFNKEFRFNEHKSYTVRELANQLKHRHNIKLREFYEPYNFNLNINGVNVNLKERNLGAEIRTNFYDEETGNDCGKIILKYKDDLIVDIEYLSGEKFYGKDLLDLTALCGIDEVIEEMIDYYNHIIDVYNQLYDVVKDDILMNPVMKKPKVRTTREYNLDEFFKNIK